MTIEADIRSRLISQSVGASVFIGGARVAAPPAMPHKAVFVREIGGPPPSPYMDGTSTDYRVVRVQCHIRGEPNDYNTAKTVANAVYSAVQKAPIAGYTRVVAEMSAPYYLGLDEKECPEFIVNVLCEGRF